METEIVHKDAMTSVNPSAAHGRAPRSRAPRGRGASSGASNADQLAARATRLLEFTSALSELTSVERVAEVVLAKGLSVVEATRGFLARTDGARLVMIAAHGYGAEMHARVMEVNEASAVPLSEAVRNGTPVWLESVDE